MAVLGVANTFIDILKGQKGFNPMKLQRLIFIAENAYLLEKKESLFDEFFSRWQHGPVIPSLFHRLKHYGANDIHHYIVQKNPATDNIFYAMVDKRSYSILNTIYQTINNFNHFSAQELSIMINQNIDWQNHEKNGDFISHQDILTYNINQKLKNAISVNFKEFI